MKKYMVLLLLLIVVSGCSPKTETPIEEEITLKTSSTKKISKENTTTSNKQISSSTTTIKTTKPTSTSKKNYSKQELEKIANDNEPYKYSVWKNKPKFNIPDEIEYDIINQKFYWEWSLVGYIIMDGISNPQYDWIVGADKTDQNSCPISTGSSTIFGEQTGHFRQASKYLPDKPNERGTKVGEKKGESYLYCYNGTYKINQKS